MKPNHFTYMIYDSKCGLCIRTISIIKRLDSWNKIQYFDANCHDVVRKNFPQLEGNDLLETMYAISPSGTAHRGFFAFRHILRYTPILWILLPVFYFPGIPWLGQKIYAWVAVNRRNLGCGSEACSLGQLSNTDNSSKRESSQQ